MKTSQVFFCIICLMGTFAYANILHIPDDFSTIQQGINASVNGDTVLVAPGTYYENINFNGKSIVVASYYLTTRDTSYIAQTVIDGNQKGTVVTIASGEDSTTALCGFVITNGYIEDFDYTTKIASGIMCGNHSSVVLSHLIVEKNNIFESNINRVSGIGCFDNSNLTMEFVVLRENEERAMICRDSSKVKIFNSSVYNNSGGGIYCEDCGITINDVTIRDNISKSGGIGIFARYSNLVIKNSKILRNKGNLIGITSLSSTRGAGICVWDSKLDIDNVRIESNSGFAGEFGSHGNGMFCYNSLVNIKNSYVASNTSTFSSTLMYGGGIAFRDCALVQLYNTKIVENFARRGGGIYTKNSILDLDKVLIRANHTIEEGGGIYNDNSDVSIKNSSINRNLSETTGGGFFCTNDNAKIEFNKTELNSVYYNRAFESGNDFACDSLITINAVLDTFTINRMDTVFADPVDNFNITWQQALVQPVSADMYVSEQGDDDNDGLSESTPFKTINKAMLTVLADSLNPHTVHVGPGLYSPSKTGESFPVIVKSHVSVVGDNPNTTILDAEQQNRVVQLYKVNNMRFQDFTIRNGNSNNDGGGIHTYLSNKIVFKELVVSNNTASSSGGGIYCSARYQSEYNILLKKILVYNNKSGFYGSGICVRGGEYTLENMTVYNNNRFDTLNNNYEYDDRSGGIALVMGSKVNLINSIIAENYPSNIRSFTIPPLGGDNILTVLFSNIQGGQDSIEIKNELFFINWLDGNIDAEPMFVGGEPFDYHLTEASPCIDAGTAFYVWEGDTLVNMDEREYSGPAPDMGAYEYGVLNRIESASAPLRFELAQNYPNPFNPVTQISYQLPHTDHVRLTVYDVLGREVKALVDADRPAGTHKVKWDGRDASGKTVAASVYFYRIETDEFTRVKKMVLLR